jgi:hypothetical protein
MEGRHRRGCVGSLREGLGAGDGREGLLNDCWGFRQLPATREPFEYAGKDAAAAALRLLRLLVISGRGRHGLLVFRSRVA